jgi:hypothetical protein
MAGDELLSQFKVTSFVFDEDEENALQSEKKEDDEEETKDWVRVPGTRWCLILPSPPPSPTLQLELCIFLSPRCQLLFACHLRALCDVD